MATYVGATEAARVLGIERATLYAYVSRGVVSRRTAVDGRTSLYALDELEELAQRSRRPPAMAVSHRLADSLPHHLRDGAGP